MSNEGELLPGLPVPPEKTIKVGVCAMANKVNSKPMMTILGLLSGFPLEKAIEYVKLRKPFCVNDVFRQKDLLDRRRVYEVLKSANIAVAKHAIVERRPDGTPLCHLREEEDAIIIDGLRFSKPFVEKPISGEDHNIHIYYPKADGGGCKKLFRKVKDRSSDFHPEESSIRRSGSYIYEEFVPTEGFDVKVYTVGPEYAHAEARKSPTLDGKVERRADGKEARYPIVLSKYEKQIAREVSLAFGQTVCGFDLLRPFHGRSLVCDVNGWSFVKGNPKYYEDASCILRATMLSPHAAEKSGKPVCSILRKKQQLILELRASVPRISRSPSLVNTPQGTPRISRGNASEAELRCVIAVMRHGDRTPKQKVKLLSNEPPLVSLYERLSAEDGKRGKEIRLKSVPRLMVFLRVVKELLINVYGESDSSLAESLSASPVIRPRTGSLSSAEKAEVWRQILAVFSDGQLKGINRKVQLKPQLSEEGPSILVVVKWGGTLTELGKEQASILGRRFRTSLYPGEQSGGLLRLHSTFRHDLKIYSSDEGRVQMTAAAFVRSFLDLEGDLTPILVTLVRKGDYVNNMLDSAKAAEDKIKEAKELLHRMLNTRDKRDIDTVLHLDSSLPASLRQAWEAIGNPFEFFTKIEKQVADVVHVLQERLAESGDVKLEDGDTLCLLVERWKEILYTLHHRKKGGYDTSKVSDIFDCAKHDLLHCKRQDIPMEGLIPLYKEAKVLADFVIPQEYGANVEEKYVIGRKIAHHLLRKILRDLNNCYDDFFEERERELSVAANAESTSSEGEGTETEYRLDPSVGDHSGVKSPLRRVRTRLYFTTESQLHALLNALRFSPRSIAQKTVFSEVISRK